MSRLAIIILVGNLALIGFVSGLAVRERLGWNTTSAQSLYWCGIARGTRAEVGLPREMPNSEAECAALEGALQR